MGFDYTAQHIYVWPGGGIAEAGEVDFSADSGATDLPTTLSKCHFLMGMCKANQIGQAFFVASDCDITNNTMTVYRQTGSTDTSATAYYLAVGY